MKEIINITKTSLTSLMVLTLMFMALEPTIGNAVEDQFTVTQVVTSEISFLTPSSDITMSPQLAGITGGTSNGSTYVRVLTNNAAGYNMTLIASSSAGMVGNSQGGFIAPYIPSSGIIPDFTFAVGSNKSAFGYTVEASTTADLAQAFMDDGLACNNGSGDVVDKCWVNSSTTARSIINRTSETANSGATTTIKFRVMIDQNPSPMIPQDTYVSTTTLTAVVN